MKTGLYCVENLKANMYAHIMYHSLSPDLAVICMHAFYACISSDVFSSVVDFKIG
jgi:hypothetical protein